MNRDKLRRSIHSIDAFIMTAQNAINAARSDLREFEEWVIPEVDSASADEGGSSSTVSTGGSGQSSIEAATPSSVDRPSFDAIAQANDPTWRASVGMFDPHDEVGRVAAAERTSSAWCRAEYETDDREVYACELKEGHDGSHEAYTWHGPPPAKPIKWLNEAAERISPVGRTHTEAVAERMANPEYRAVATDTEGPTEGQIVSDLSKLGHTRFAGVCGNCGAQVNESPCANCGDPTPPQQVAVDDKGAATYEVLEDSTFFWPDGKPPTDDASVDDPDRKPHGFGRLSHWAHGVLSAKEKFVTELSPTLREKYIHDPDVALVVNKLWRYVQAEKATDGASTELVNTRAVLDAYKQHHAKLHPDCDILGPGLNESADSNSAGQESAE